MDKIRKNIYSIFVKPFIVRKLKETTNYSYGGLDIVVYPGVFHPQYFFSTNFFLDYIYDIEFRKKSFCEVGCGSGIISLLAFRNGARVKSFDISQTAVKNALENYSMNFNDRNHPDFSMVKSDLFDKISPREFDYIYINPPYFFKEPKSVEQKAWYCGKEGEYYKKLFYQLPDYSGPATEILMVLSDNCDLKRIEKIAENFGYGLEIVQKTKIKWEWNFLFRLRKI
jgi:release factor glutamine methyltransferase